MLYNSIGQVDLQRVRDCLRGKITYRGCGKTIARVMLMISNALVDADSPGGTAQTNYLFIGENNQHVQNIQRMATTFLNDLKFEILGYSLASGYVKTYWQGTYIGFHFFSPEDVMCKVRGTSYRKIIVDLTTEMRSQHRREIQEILQIYQMS